MRHLNTAVLKRTENFAATSNPSSCSVRLCENKFVNRVDDAGFCSEPLQHPTAEEKSNTRHESKKKHFMPDRPTVMNDETKDELKKQDLSKVTEQRILAEQDNNMIYGALQIDVSGQIVDKFQHE
jgi:hypothetical protein